MNKNIMRKISAGLIVVTGTVQAVIGLSINEMWGVITGVAGIVLILCGFWFLYDARE
jgi:hypothetical protein